MRLRGAFQNYEPWWGTYKSAKSRVFKTWYFNLLVQELLIENTYSRLRTHKHPHGQDLSRRLQISNISPQKPMSRRHGKLGSHCIVVYYAGTLTMPVCCGWDHRAQCELKVSTCRNWASKPSAHNSGLVQESACFGVPQPFEAGKNSRNAFQVRSATLTRSITWPWRRRMHLDKQEAPFPQKNLAMLLNVTDVTASSSLRPP